MPTEVIMPQMGESIAEGTIIKWYKKPGESVDRDEPLFEISTDKVDTEIPSPAAGVLSEVRVAEGETVPINTVVAVISEAMTAPTLDSAAAPESSEQEPPSEPVSSSVPPVPGPAAQPPTAGADSSGESRDVRSSPLVRRIAREHGVDLSRIQGTGRGGRISKQDILAFVEGKAQARPPVERESPPPIPAAAPATEGVPAPVPPPAPVSELSVESPSGEVPLPDESLPPTEPLRLDPALSSESLPPAESAPSSESLPPAESLPSAESPPPPESLPRIEPVSPEGPSPSGQEARSETVPMTSMRKSIAQHMIASRRTSAHVTSVFEVDVTRIVRIREQHKEEFARAENVKLTYTPFFARAVIEGLKSFPIINASVDGDAIIHHKDINLGVAVALDWGLIVPVVKRADEKSFLGLARSVNDLAERARIKKLKLEEIQGGTFTLTNPGPYGALFGTPIINQPQVAILGLGGIHKRPVVVNDAIAVRSMVYLALSFDHRIIDGAVADQFMAEVKKRLQNWEESIL